MKLLWFLTIVGAVVGGWNYLETITLATSAPQQAAGMALAAASAILPYIFARACQEFGNVPTHKQVAATSPEAPTRLAKMAADRDAAGPQL